MILKLGDIVFETDMSYDEIRSQTGWQWEEIPIAGGDPVLQFSHNRARTLNIKGTWWNYAKDDNKLGDIRQAGYQHEPLLLVDDEGNNYGYWVIEELSTTGQFFRYRQREPIKNEWQLRIKYAGATQ